MQCTPLIEKMLLSALALKLPPVPLIMAQKKRSFRSPYWASCFFLPRQLIFCSSQKKTWLKNVITGEGEELIAKGREQPNRHLFQGAEVYHPGQDFHWVYHCFLCLEWRCFHSELAMSSLSIYSVSALLCDLAPRTSVKLSPISHSDICLTSFPLFSPFPSPQFILLTDPFKKPSLSHSTVWDTILKITTGTSSVPQFP